MRTKSPEGQTPEASTGRHSLNRRKFLRAAGVATAALAFGQTSTSSYGESGDDGGEVCSNAQPPNTYNVVTQGGAHGDGVTDDLQAILDAISDCKQQGCAGLYFPPGTSYALSAILLVPDDTHLYGPCNIGPSSSNLPWLMGRVDYGSNCVFEDLKIGPMNAGRCALQNGDGSNGTRFSRCHFRGGGGAYQDSVNYSTITIGRGKDVSNLTFVSCEFERSLGAQWAGSDSDPVARENTISLYASGNTIDGVTFQGCHFGVTNGVAAGAQRMMIECWTAPGTSNYWRNLTFTNCLFETSRSCGLDFACYGPASSFGIAGRSGGALVEGCTFKGSGADGIQTGAYCICIEGANDITVRNNTFYASRSPSLNTLYFGWPATPKDTFIIKDNTFDWDVDNVGLTLDGSMFDGPIVLCALSYSVFTGNTLKYSGTGLNPYYGFLGFNGATYQGTSGGSYNIATGNYFRHNASWPDANLIKNQNGATGNSPLSENSSIDI